MCPDRKKKLINLNKKKKKEKNTQISKMRKQRGNITTDYIKRIISEYYEQLYANKLGKGDKMDNFLERYKLLKST